MESKFIMKTNKVFKRFIAFMLSTLCILTNCSIGLSISSVELTEEFTSDVAPEGYVPVESFDEIAMFSLERDSSITKKVLLIEDTLPWSSNANSAVLSSLGVSYDKVKTADFLTKNLGNYSVLIFANDQQFSTYANYSNFMTQVENFAALGGVVIFGACDGGWANGTMTTSLPGGVTKFQQYANNNHVVNSSHPIVTGVLIDNIPLTDSDLYSNYCSHTSFNETSLPIGSNVILRDTIRNAPTLVEYPVGSGRVIASGLTWEHSYVQHINDSYGHFAQKALADLFIYAIVTSNANVDMAPPLAVSVTSPSKLNVVENELGNEEYSPNPFTITANIQNIGNGIAYNVNAELVLPDGMKIVSGSPKVSLGDIDVGANYAQVTWSVEVEPSDIDKIENYSIIVTANNADTKTVEKQIEIPALLSSEVELYLKRGVIVDGETLRLNFKIKNVGSSKLDLSKIKTRYYYFDEVHAKEKKFECDAVSFNPYSYIQNPQITMTDNKLETLHDKSTSYLEFNFNVSEELNPNQEIEVNARIHTSDWSKLLLSNDYSAVGDDSLPSNDFEQWQYMPVYRVGDNEEIIWGSEPEIDTNEIEPNLLVEFNSDSKNNSSNMLLNIKITNIGMLPVDLGQTEIKYYYTNDKKVTQEIKCNHAAFNSGNNYLDITSKVKPEIIKMSTRKKNADSYVSLKFSEDTGILNYEDYTIVKLNLENSDGKNGNILDNDHSYPADEEEVQTFSAKARATLHTDGMKVAKNIVISSVAMPFFMPMPNDKIEFIFGESPLTYEPTFSAFKVGQGNKNENKIDDYNSFISIMENKYNYKKYSDYACAENINNNLTFTYENLQAVLESDVLYISGHGSRGGVIPIYNSGKDSISEYTQIFTTDAKVGSDYQNFNVTNINTSNVFSVNMKDNDSNKINENLQWIIAAACSQLNSTTNSTSISSVDRWIDVLKNNKELKGVIGYYETAPIGGDIFTVAAYDDKIIKAFLNSSEDIYHSWIKANISYEGDNIFSKEKKYKKCGLLVKDDYAYDTLYDSLQKTTNYEFEKIVYYTVDKDTGNVTSTQYKNDLAITLRSYGIDMSCIEDEFIINRTVYNSLGKRITTEDYEVIFSCSVPYSLYSGDDTTPMFIKYNIIDGNIEII